MSSSAHSANTLSLKIRPPLEKARGSSSHMQATSHIAGGVPTASKEVRSKPQPASVETFFYLHTTVCWEWVGQIIHISHSQVSKKRSGVAHEILDIMLQLGETLGKFWEDDECILWAVRKEMNIYDPVSRLWWNRLLLPVLLSLSVFGSCIHILCYLSSQYLLLEWVEYISLPKH